mmetsp:Transcript_23879/g.70488  ORF Transcript_23879/g.70488 Transcript_23879/m.70488 type:complete len:90 (+) Transcript_23879:1030-1299(+)
MGAKSKLSTDVCSNRHNIARLSAGKFSNRMFGSTCPLLWLLGTPLEAADNDDDDDKTRLMELRLLACRPSIKVSNDHTAATISLWTDSS